MKTKSLYDINLIGIEVMKAEVHLFRHVLHHLKKGDLLEDWYVGITGQKSTKNDGKSDRIIGHKQKFPNLIEHTWEEYWIDKKFGDKKGDIGKQVERNMKNAGFDVGKKIQDGSLPIYIVYTFKKGKKDLRNKK